MLVDQGVIYQYHYPTNPTPRTLTRMRLLKINRATSQPGLTGTENVVMGVGHKKYDDHIMISHDDSDYRICLLYLINIRYHHLSLTPKKILNYC